MTKKTSGRTALVLAIGLLSGLAVPSWAADPQADAANVAAPVSPADAQAAAANQAAPSSQLSDADRAARQDDIRMPVIVTQQNQQTQPETPPVRANPVLAGSQNATWDETSLIGKIFIGFGALLTIASAARMFMA